MRRTPGFLLLGALGVTLLLGACETLSGDVPPTAEQCDLYRERVAFWQQQAATRPGDLEAIGWLTFWSARYGRCPQAIDELGAFQADPTAPFLITP